MAAATNNKARRLVVGVCVLALLGGAGWAWSNGLLAKLIPAKAQTTATRGAQGVPVTVARAERKPMPVRFDAIGAVEPLVTVSIRTRVASRVEKVSFEDGAQVNQGDVLFVLDPREIEAQLMQAEATLNKDKSQLEKALRDVDRYTGLLARAAVSQVQVDDAKTTADMQKATVQQDEANLKALQVQRSYYEIKAPVSGRMGISQVRPGAVIRVDDTLATIRQIKPIYVAFGVPERYLVDVRTSMERATVTLRLQGAGERVGGGKLAALDNTIDPQSGTLMVRAIFDNADERLWPGTLGDVTVTLRMEPDALAVPNEAVQSGQNGTFVFVVDNGVAKVQPVTVNRTVDGQAVISSGLSGGETVVTEGQLALRNGSKVDIKKQAGTPSTGS
ncbi:MAG: hypothetical protein B7Y84_07475 [Azorhizobium sp. 32-67-21]|nr:MAG: hypothetical protein B7Y84_07475 [Azorhizobium sp. 32-67-21]